MYNGQTNYRVSQKTLGILPYIQGVPKTIVFRNVAVLLLRGV